MRLTELAGFVGRSLKLTHDVEVEAAAAPESPVSLLDRIVLHALRLDSTSFLHSAACVLLYLSLILINGLVHLVLLILRYIRARMHVLII